MRDREDLFSLPTWTKTDRAPQPASVARMTGLPRPGAPAGRAARAQHFATLGRTARPKTAGRSTPSQMRRVVIKARVVRMGPTARAALLRHLGYVQRDGVTREGEAGRHFDRSLDEADGRAFVDRCSGDRHHFRFIVSPEDGAELGDLKRYTRELMDRMERDLGTKLDWIAGEHHDTGRAHLHLLVRGRRDDGRDLVVPRNYIGYGMRERAQELATERLGPRLEQARGAEERLVEAERYTVLDRQLEALARGGLVQQADLALGEGRPEQLAQRLCKLEELGAAERGEPGLWRLDGRFREKLRDLGEQSAREAVLTRLLGGQPDWSRIEPFAPAAKEGGMLVGQYVGVGPLSPYRDGPQLCLLESLDGRLQWFRTPSTEALWALDRLEPGAIVSVAPRAPEQRASDVTIAEIAEANGGRYSAEIHKQARPTDRDAFVERHVRRLEGLSREGAAERIGDGVFQLKADYLDAALTADRARFGAVTLDVNVLDARSIEQQAGHQGTSFLDGLIDRQSRQLVAGGFTDAVQDAMRARQDTLIQLGVGMRGQDGAFRFGDGWRVTLVGQEIEGAFASLRAERGKTPVIAEAGTPFAGVYNGRVQIGSTSYAVFEGRQALTLAPWRPALESVRGQMLTAAWDGRSVDFTLGNQLGSQIGKALGKGLGLSL